MWKQGQKTAFLVGFIERMNLKDIYFEIHTDISIISFNFRHKDLQIISDKQTQLLLKQQLIF